MRSARPFLVSATIALLLIAGGVLFGYRYYQGQVNDSRRVGQPAVSVDIPLGTGVSGIGDILAAKGLVGNTLVYEIYVRTSGLSGRLEAGHYTIPGGASMADALARMSHATGSQVSVTIPEGYTTKQIAAVMQAKGLFAASAYVDAATNGSYSQPFLVGRPRGYGVEGYLFPDTYFLDTKATAVQVINVQLDHFAQQVPPELRQRAAAQHVTFSQAVVLASIIEREAQFDKDRAYVAAVFYNRLSQGVPLQSDATVGYAKGQASNAITEQDKLLNSPFNTYLHSGLPPAPISNPGLASIRAALQPAAGFDYLYFLTDSTGHAHFSKTLAQHNQCQVNLAACPTAP
jgi:UPF0755 protein